MSKDKSRIIKDIQGLGKLTVDAIKAITEIVETMHHTILNLGEQSNESEPKKTKGVTGLVYNNIRNITDISRKGLDASLQQLNNVLPEGEASPKREAMLSALNGLLGDYLKESDNSLSISMQFRRDGKRLSHNDLAKTIEHSNGKLLIMVHGSCMNDMQWCRKDHDHGIALSHDLGITPLYLHYNTGLHTSENGKSLSHLLEELMAQSAQPIELSLLAYSMGGLVSRSACHYAEKLGHTWVKKLKKLVFLGTPHHGALLEKGSNWIENILETNPYSAPFARLTKIRSRGLTDLRYGNVVDEDWNDDNRFEITSDNRIPVPLPTDVQCYTVAGTTKEVASKVGDDLIGDGLVTVKSALGHHPNAQLQLLFPESHQYIARQVNHFQLLSHPDVYDVLKRWLVN